MDIAPNSKPNICQKRAVIFPSLHSSADKILLCVQKVNLAFLPSSYTDESVIYLAIHHTQIPTEHIKTRYHFFSQQITRAYHFQRKKIQFPRYQQPLKFLKTLT